MIWVKGITNWSLYLYMPARFEYNPMSVSIFLSCILYCRINAPGEQSGVFIVLVKLNEWIIPPSMICVTQNLAILLYKLNLELLSINTSIYRRKELGFKNYNIFQYVEVFSSGLIVEWIKCLKNSWVKVN